MFNGSFLRNYDLRHDGRVVLNHSKCDSLEILFGFAVKVDLDRVIGSPNASCDTSGKAWPFFLHNGAIVLFHAIRAGCSVKQQGRVRILPDCLTFRPPYKAVSICMIAHLCMNRTEGL